MPPRKRAWAFGLAPVMCWAGAWLRLNNKGWALPDAWAWAGPRPRPRLGVGHNGLSVGPGGTANTGSPSLVNH